MGGLWDAWRCAGACGCNYHLRIFGNLGWVGSAGFALRAAGCEWKPCGRRVVMMVERWLWVVVMACVATGAAAATTQPARLGVGDHWRALEVDGWRRPYLVHVPRGYDAGKATPVVLAFHGSLMNGAMMAMFSGLSAKADDAGFIVAYPNGTGFGQGCLFFNAWAAPGGRSRLMMCGLPRRCWTTWRGG